MLFNTLIALLLVYVVMRAMFESLVFPATIRCIATGARHRRRAAVFYPGHAAGAAADLLLDDARMVLRCVIHDVRSGAMPRRRDAGLSAEPRDAQRGTR
ncbi:MAG: hypothetical protein ACYDCY_08845 [Metallibacterium sp.]